MYGLQVSGRRAILARFPNANPETDLFPKGWISSKTTWVAPKSYPDPHWVFDTEPVRNVSTMFLVCAAHHIILATCTTTSYACVGVRTTWLVWVVLARYATLWEAALREAASADVWCLPLCRGDRCSTLL